MADVSAERVQDGMMTREKLARDRATLLTAQTRANLPAPSRFESSLTAGRADVSAADALIVTWDNKRAYNVWRPSTAIFEGANDGNPRTLEEVGREFGVTPERIRQIEWKILRKLRHPGRS